MSGDDSGRDWLQQQESLELFRGRMSSRIRAPAVAVAGVHSFLTSDRLTLGNFHFYAGTHFLCCFLYFIPLPGIVNSQPGWGLGGGSRWAANQQGPFFLLIPPLR